MNDNSWRIKSYHKGKYTVSVRQNFENDRIDEGDCPKDEVKNNKCHNNKLK
ncbi:MULTISPECIES: hypothetical protein [Bacillaceae]|uniref:hypothetical protein n=1 Tax=Bacillaceae TaxID=186817 RepID=UPI00159B9BDE|nr:MULTISPECIES: hypothetical protein [Bacillaceae]MCM3164336.1 hypothetical protein [Metabacillus litoralis]UGB33723.1 hypothetical protein LPC09_26070 [Metabacillus sp. B2-18]